MVNVEGRWEGMEEADKPKLVMVVMLLKLDLFALGRITEDQALLQIQLRAQRQSVYYIMG